MNRTMTNLALIALLSVAFATTLAFAGCSGGSTEEIEEGGGEGDEGGGGGEEGGGGEVARKQQPPPSGERRAVRFPPIARSNTASGLEINAVEWNAVPAIYLQLVIKSGGETDPQGMPGLAAMVATMLKEGTRTRTSAQLAEDVEFLGASLDTWSDEENVYIQVRALSEHLDQAMAILGDVAQNPRFDQTELRKLKTRELDRLALQLQDANFLATREMHKALYGSHPYAFIDTTADVVNRVQRTDLQRWHRTHFVPNNAVLVAVGAVPAAQVQAAAEQRFASWRRADVAAPQYPEPPAITARRVILVDRPESVQSVIAIGNLAMARNNPDYVPLMVANQVLGGSAASRLFMDLRERRSLTYGAYSRLVESVQIAPFRARAQVRNEVTGRAMEAFMEHLERITTEAPPQEELQNAHNYLSDSFPLLIDTPGKGAGLVADLRVYGLPDDYWETYRGAIREVDSREALAAAAEYIHPDRSIGVVVGRAAEVIEPLRRWGTVTVVDVAGQPVEAVNPPATGGNAPAPAPAPAPAVPRTGG